MIDYAKQPLNISDQLILLKNNNLTIDSDEIARDFLSNVSYCRFNYYCKPFKINGVFIDCNFELIKNIYICDQRLRNLVLYAIERIEIAIRTKMSNIVCCKINNAHWYLDEENFKRQEYFNKTSKIINTQLKQRKNENFIKHYNEKYSPENKPPFWMIIEILTFSQLSKLFNQINRSYQQEIAKVFSLSGDILSTFLYAISEIRNISAHHGALFNRVMKIKPKKNNKISITKESKFYNSYLAINYLLSVIHPKNSFTKKVDEIMLDIGEFRAYYGFSII